MDNWKNQIHHGDCLDVLLDIPDDSIDLVVTSPPYNVGVDYGEYEDDVSQSRYNAFISALFSLLKRKVKDSGRVAVNISLKNDGGIIDTPLCIKKQADLRGWDLRFEIIWNKQQSESSSAWGSWRSPSSPRPIFNHEYIYVYDVGDEDKEYHQSIEKERFMEIVKSVWNVRPDTSNEHPASFPVEIPKRLIELNSYENDVVLDPFMGSGTTAIAAEQTNREWVGIELNDEYIGLAEERLQTHPQQEEQQGIFDY